MKNETRFGDQHEAGRAAWGPPPRFARDLLASCPAAGQGVHRWLFRCARVLHRSYPDGGELADLLLAASAGCGRAISRREALEAVSASRACAWLPGQGQAGPPPPAQWPAPEAALIAAIAAQGIGMADLWESSPVRFEDGRSYAEEIIDGLFPGNPLLCVGASAREFDTRPREDWRGGLARQSLIVPSPMTSRQGATRDGRPSRHTLSNTGPRRFLVVEFDQGAADTHAARLLYLARYAPLAAVVHSGNKSLHGWFWCAGKPEDQAREFFRRAVSLGADPATWTRSQFVRLPDGRREGGRRQTCFYFNPNLIKTV